MDYRSHLAKDKKLAGILKDREAFTLQFHPNICLRLCASIMSQQLSTKVAAIIYKRFLELYDGKEPDPADILATPNEKLRGIGLSHAKVQYVKNVASFALEHKLNDIKFKKMDDETIVELLTQIKGVGKWTVEMLLMFTLGREDIFSIDDLGIQMAMKKLYRIKDSAKKDFREKINRIAEKWSPYRTYACLHLWQWRDEVKK